MVRFKARFSSHSVSGCQLSLRSSFLFFLRRNWGFWFVTAFILLEIFSALELGLGTEDLANKLALYGFYLLVMGIMLQITSSFAYGKLSQIHGPTKEALKQVEATRRYKAIASVSVILVLILGASVVYSTASPGAPVLPVGITSLTTSISSQHTSTVFEAKEFFSEAIPEPNNETLVSFGIVASGGSSPYVFSAVWSDAFTQSNNYGTFSRTILQGQMIPSSAIVTVTGSNGKVVTVTVTIPKGNVSTSSTNTQGVFSLAFVKVGLPSDITWSVDLNGSLQTSKNAEITFYNQENGNYNFSINYEFNGNYNSAYNFTPGSGIVTLDGTNKVQNVTFTQIASDQLVTPQALPKVMSGNGSILITVPYRNNLPVSIEATELVVVNESSRGIVTTSSSEISLNPESVSQGEVYLTGLVAGNYSVALYVLSSNNTVISPESVVNFTLPLS